LLLLLLSDSDSGSSVVVVILLLLLLLLRLRLRLLRQQEPDQRTEIRHGAFCRMTRPDANPYGLEHDRFLRFDEHFWNNAALTWSSNDDDDPMAVVAVVAVEDDGRDQQMLDIVASRRQTASSPATRRIVAAVCFVYFVSTIYFDSTNSLSLSLFITLRYYYCRTVNVNGNNASLATGTVGGGAVVGESSK